MAIGVQQGGFQGGDGYTPAKRDIIVNQQILSFGLAAKLFQILSGSIIPSKMAGFEFGSINDIEAQHVVGVVEVLLEDKVLYKSMLQIVYKELMLMGLLSFSVTMGEALQTSEQHTSLAAWIHGIDFVHILLFYLTIFFVVHAFYLLSQSVRNMKYYSYLKFNSTPEVLLDLIEETEKNPISSFLYKYVTLFPFSNNRDKVEYYLIREIFREMYWLPNNFDFASYLSGCFDRYTLRAMHRSIFTWTALIAAVLFNFGRIRLALSCKPPATEGGHRYLSGTTDDHAATDDHSSHYYGADTPKKFDNECTRDTINLFLGCGAVLCIYAVYFTMVATVIKQRLVNKIGLGGPKHYQIFLQYVQQYNENQNIMLAQTADVTMSNASIIKKIERALDAEEHEEDEEGFKFLAQMLISFNQFAGEAVADATMNIKVAFLKLVHPQQIKDPKEKIDLDSFIPNADRNTMHKAVSDDHEVAHSQSFDSDYDKNSLSNFHVGELYGEEANRSGALVKSKSTSTVRSTREKNHAHETKIPNHNKNVNFHKVNVFVAKSKRIVNGGTNSKADEQHNNHKNIDHSVGKKDIFVDPTNINSTNNINDSMPLNKLPDYATPPQSSTKRLSSKDSVTSDHENGSSPHRISRKSSSFSDNLSPVMNTKFKNEGLSMLNAKDTFEIGDNTIVLDVNNKKGLNSINHNEIDTNIPTTSLIEDESNEEESNEENEDWMKHLDQEITESFKDIYPFRQPEWFYKSFGLLILLNCLYASIWITNFIIIVRDAYLHQERTAILYELGMIIPMIIVMPCVGYISRTCSLISAVTELNLEVVSEVLQSEEDSKLMVSELRAQLNIVIMGVGATSLDDKKKVVKQLFDQFDVDGSGEIDKTEFRALLRKLKLTYTNQRFRKLFKIIDSDGGGNGQLSLDELTDFLFPPEEPNSRSISRPASMQFDQKSLNQSPSITNSSLPFPYHHAKSDSSGNLGDTKSNDNSDGMTF
eukprot:gene10905-14640_t